MPLSLLTSCSGPVNRPGRTITHKGRHMVISLQEELERGWTRRMK